MGIYGCQGNWVNGDYCCCVRMNSNVYIDLLSAHKQTNAAKLLGWHFTLEMHNDPPPKKRKEPNTFSMQCNWIFFGGQVYHWNLIKHFITY